jgi:hypothetical protein
MVKLPQSSNRPKGMTKPARPGASRKEVGASPEKKVISRADKIVADTKAERVFASRILRDIRETAGDLSARADRLLRRVS